MNVLTVDETTGGLAFWSEVGDIPRAEVHEAARLACIDDLVPAAPPPSTALREAMDNTSHGLFGKRKHEPIQILQTSAQRTFECVRIWRGDHVNEHRFLFSATVHDDGRVEVLAANNANYMRVEDASGNQWSVAAVERELQAQYDRCMTILPCPLVTKVIASALHRWGGTCLKNRGGLWFFPSSCRPKYEAWANHLAKHGCAFTFAVLSVSKNPTFISHLLDEVTGEVLDGLKSIQDDILSGSAMQDRSIRLRQQRTQEFLDKIRMYEDMTGRTLADLRDCVSTVQHALGVQKMLAVSA